MIPEPAPLISTSQVEAKAHLRNQARDLRAAAHKAASGATATRIAALFRAALPSLHDRVVAGYWPKGDELDVRPLLSELAADGVACALPVTGAADQPLRFRRWRPGDRLEVGPFGISQPTAEAETMVPDVLVVPLLAFDPDRHRLGYGGGYYDRTLTVLRRQDEIVAVGVAYAAQRIEYLVVEDHDQPLDLVITEQGVVA